MEEAIKSRKKTLLIAYAFIALFTGLLLYKILFLRYPLVSKPVENLWTLELKIEGQSVEGEAVIRHFLPRSDRGQVVLREDFVSNEFYFVIGTENSNAFIEWRGRQLKDALPLFYRATVQTTPRIYNLDGRALEGKYPPDVLQYLYTETEMESIGVEIKGFLKELIGEKKTGLEKIKTIYRFLTEAVATVPLSREPALVGPIKTRKGTIAQKRELFIHLSRMAGIPARSVHGIVLEENFRKKKIHSWVSVFLGGKWIPVDIENRLFARLPENMLILFSGERPFITSSGVEELDYSYSMRKETQRTFGLFYETATKAGARAYEWSLFSLPLEIQQVFRIILLIPLGALVVSIFRNIIGINTFGTFMPVLIALAFRNTKLGWGLVLFSIVISLGLASRWFMDRLKLLVVPRLAVIVTVLVIILASTSLIGHRIGIYRVLAVALFPMVIMTMTIERLSIILMERGGKEAVKVSLGTLLVSTSGYFVMSVPSIQEFFFAFPEILFALIGIQILLGRYTGYRLTEYFRFHSFITGED